MSNYFNEDKIVFLERQDFNDDGSFKYKNSKPVLIMLFGTGCGYCKKSAPVFGQICKNNKNIICCAIQTDGQKEEQDVANLLVDTVAPEIQGIPTFLLYKNGQFKGIYKGDRSYESLVDFALR